MKARENISVFLSTAGLGVITLVMLFPIIAIIFTSFKPPDEIVAQTPSLMPHHFILDNYAKLFTLRDFRGYFLNSLLVSGLTTLITMTIASVACFALVWMRTPAKKLVARSFFLAYMFPRIMLAIPLAMVCYETHLIDNRFALVLAYMSFTLPFAIWFLKSFFESIPSGLIEAAKLDGCSELQCLRRIVLPVSFPVLTTTAILCFVLAWNEYLYANTILLSESNRTVAVGLQTLMGNYHIDYGLLTAAGVIIVLPVVALFLAAQKYIMRGLALSNSKE
jgi:multiple sugar transport system permease protein